MSKSKLNKIYLLVETNQNGTSVYSAHKSLYDAMGLMLLRFDQESHSVVPSEYNCSISKDSARIIFNNTRARAKYTWSIMPLEIN